MNCYDLIKSKEVQKALVIDRGPAAKLIHFRVKDFKSKGEDRYVCSVVTSVELTFEMDGKEQQTTYVVKMNSLRPALEKVAAVYFEKEIGFYKQILPLLNKELKRLQLGSLGLPVYLHAVNKHKEEVIFFKDLRKEGFEMMRRKEGMDKNHTMLITKELARLHATSVVLMSNEEFLRRNLLKKFSFLEEAYFKMMDESGRNLIFSRVRRTVATIAAVAEMNEGYELVGKFCRSVLANFNNVVEDFLECSEPFVVFGHGDCRIENFLFK